jgi:hypothetical protein
MGEEDIIPTHTPTISPSSNLGPPNLSTTSIAIRPSAKIEALLRNLHREQGLGSQSVKPAVIKRYPAPIYGKNF